VVSLISPLSGIREHNPLINISDINERCYKVLVGYELSGPVWTRLERTEDAKA
jgi:hypothetical protein